MATHNLSVTLGKLSNLLIQESNLLLGVESYIQRIEDLLRGKVDLLEDELDQRKITTIIVNIECAIYELIIRSNHRQEKDDFIRYSLPFGTLPKSLFFVLIVMELIDHSRLVQKLSRICSEIAHMLMPPPVQLSGSFDFMMFRAAYRTLGGSFEERNNGEFGNAIISTAIRQLEALEAEKQLSPPVKRQVMWLCDKLKSCHDFLTDVEIETLSAEDMVWVYELFEVCFSANNIVSSFLCLMHKKGPLNKLIWASVSQNKLAKKISQLKDHVIHISSRKPKLILTPIPLSNNVGSSPFVCAGDKLDIVSFDEDVDAIIAKLLIEDTRCITISIVGATGIGKTSLANLVYSNNAIVRHFPLRRWISGAKEVDIMEKFLGVQSCLSDGQVIRMVNTVYANTRFLIVVDASCARDCWIKMRGLLWNFLNGSRIIFTVCKPKEAPLGSDTNFSYKLHLRTNDESWALFMHTLKLNISSQLEKDLKKLILRKCGGLPKAIVNMAGLLSMTEATLEEWSRVLEQLNQDEEPWPLIKKDINKYLPLYLRRCLFYFGLFPADYKIPARRLINLWVAEGLVCGKATEISAEHVAEQCLEELVDYNMVQVIERKLNGKIKTCCLPEPLCVHWLEKAREVNFLHSHSNMTCGVRRLADHLNPDDAIFHHVHDKDSNCLYPFHKESVTFLSFNGREEAGQDRPILPKTLSKLTQLKYLGLRSTYLQRLPMFIHNLLNLQTLDLKRTCINALPRSIWKMQELRHLFLDESFRTMFVPCQEGRKLNGLQTIWGVYVDESSPVKNGLDTLPNITKLGLKSKVSMPSQKDAMSSQLVAVENWVMNLKGLKKLRLKSFDESEKPWILHLESLSDHSELTSVYLAGELKNRQLESKFPQNLIELTLSASRLANDPMQTLDKLQKLRILRLFSRSFTGKKMLCGCGGFPKLEILKVRELEVLESWDVEEGSLPSLKELDIRRCMNLKTLPDGLQCIQTLRKIKLTQLPLLSPRIKDTDSEDWKKIAHVSDICIQDC
ncbi:NB-ARC domain-containing disease resistance protein [Euphorbia peplus]|nr:NB-ARC domain-containing disease resistance protein [Euphorbia peplus]